MPFTLRPFTADDLFACLIIFDGLRQDSLAAADRAEFAAFLEAPPHPYFVLQDENQTIVGSGGYFVSNETGRGGLAWGMISRGWEQELGLKKLLLLLRLEQLCGQANCTSVWSETDAASKALFEQVGFEVDHVQAVEHSAEADHGEQADRYVLKLPITPGLCEKLAEQIAALSATL